MDPTNKLEGSKAFARVIARQAQDLTTLQRDCPAFCIGVANILQTIEQLMDYRGNGTLAQQLQPIYRAILDKVDAEVQEPHNDIVPLPHEIAGPSIWEPGQVVPSVEEFRRISSKLVEHSQAKTKAVGLSREDFRRLAGLR